jgi:DNA-binding PadR family transcriptional regulator
MRVRDALLVLLTSGPTHGYQLKVDYERSTRGGKVNVGQIYKTLELLQRDGLVERDEATAGDRRIAYRITTTGRKAASEALLDTSDVPVAGLSSIATRVLLAIRVGCVDPLEVIDTQRAALLASVQAARRAMRIQELTTVERLGVEAELAFRDSDLRWLDVCEAELRGER